MPAPDARRGQVESNVLRSPIWDAAQRMRPDPAPISARSLLGADLQVTASHRLSMRDLAVLAHATERLPATGTDAPTSLHALGHAIYGRTPSGRDRQRLHESLRRLVDLVLTIPGYDVTRNRIVGELGQSRAHLLEAVFEEHRYLRLVTPAEMGALRGTEPVRIRLALWYADQVRGGHTTYLDLAMFRLLGVGLAARVWTFLEAESYTPKTPDLESTYIGLGGPALAGLDLAGYARQRDARAKLAAAGARIVKTDARYQRVEVRPSRYGHELMAVRLRGGRELEERRRIRATTRAAGLPAT